MPKRTVFFKCTVQECISLFEKEGDHLLLGPFPDKKLGAKVVFISIWQKKEGGRGDYISVDFKWELLLVFKLLKLGGDTLSFEKLKPTS